MGGVKKERRAVASASWIPQHQSYRWQPTHNINSTQPSGSVLLLLGQRQWPHVEQQRVERQLLVFDVELSPQRTEPELQLRRSKSAEQQQSVQRVRLEACAALINFILNVPID